MSSKEIVIKGRSDTDETDETVRCGDFFFDTVTEALGPLNSNHHFHIICK